MAQIPPGTRPLRRSFSEHVKDSTNKAWNVFWRGVRERRLWGESVTDVGADVLAWFGLGTVFLGSSNSVCSFGKVRTDEG